MRIYKDRATSHPPGSKANGSPKEEGHNQRLGSAGENLVALEYEKQGYEIIGRNVRVPRAEIDIIAKSPEGIYCFVEVKSRSSTRFGGLEAITPAKLRRMHRAALSWLFESKHYGCPYRVDVAELIMDPGGHVLNVISGVD
ncbi:MAG: YraN family protein [Corynebacterium sp.]|nr:YraN family protein [Corynebacterium sp.]